MKCIIHVNRHHIAANAKDGGDRPVYAVKQGRKTTYCREVTISGLVKLIYNGKKLKCGARAWIVAEGAVTMIDPMSWTEVQKVLK